jgi:hypothetical protein
MIVWEREFTVCSEKKADKILYLLWLIWCTLRVALSIATTQPTSLSPFRRVFALSSCPVASKARKRRGVVRRVVAMSLYRLAYIYIYIYTNSQSFDLSRATMWQSWQHAARQRAVWRASLATDRQDKGPTTLRLTLCRAIARDNTTHKSNPNQPPSDGGSNLRSSCITARSEWFR